MSWPIQHLRLRLRPIQRALHAAVHERREERDKLPLHQLDDMLASGRTRRERLAATEEELAEEQHLRERATAQGVALPIDGLVRDYALESFEIEALLAAALVDLDRRYRTVISFLHEDSRLQRPTIDLVADLGSTTLVERIARRAQLGRLGRLRRLGFIRSGDAGADFAPDLAITPRAFDMLCGHAAPEFRDPLEIAPAEWDVEDERLTPLFEGVRAQLIGTIGIWGGAADARLDVARTLARAVGRALRRPWERGRTPADPGDALQQAARDAAELGALLWIDADTVSEDTVAIALEEVPSTIAVISARDPMRSARVVVRAYAEIELSPPTFETRREMWRSSGPHVTEAQASALAARYRVDRTTIAAAAAMSRLSGTIEQSAALVAQPRSLRFADLVTPRRTFDDLVLPPGEERQVRDIAETYLAWPRVAERWGFSTTSSIGVKALFTGEPGTGKTIAAETVAGHLGLSLVRIDLARVVSKWVGETEKNLDAAFTEAADAGALLFFDEAEALFGKRGEVQHGTDRYANLEVSFLLQRLERHDGLVILASNLRDEIDPAFVRRFQHVVHFPRPAERERRRLWRLAFPKDAPLAADVDLSVIARLDMTGAAIVTSARVAALNAARVGASTIGVPEIVEAVTGQFQREARALTATDLGPYGHALRPLRAS